MSSQIIDGWKPIRGVPGKTIVTQNSDGSYTVTIDPSAIGDGSGDMLKAVYDIDGNDIVDAAESVPWAGVTDKPLVFPPDTHDHDDRYYTESEIGTILGDYVAKSLYDANTILYATTDDTPTALTVGASTLVGRGAAGGIAALSASDACTVLGLATTDSPTFAGVTVDGTLYADTIDTGANLVQETSTALVVSGTKPVDVQQLVIAEAVAAPQSPVALLNPVGVWNFDGPAPYNLDFTGTNVSHMGIGGTEAGDVIYRPGKFGKAVQLAESTTNLISNPSIETDTTGWSSDGTATQSEEKQLYGAYSLKIVGATYATYSAGGSGHTSVSANTTYTATAWIWSPIATTVGMYIFEYNSAGTYLGIATSSSPSISIGWNRIKHTVTTSASTGKIRPSIRGINSSYTFYIDAVQVEQKAYPTPYTDTSRAGASLSYGITGVTADAWTVALWINSSGWNNSGAYGYILNFYGGGGRRMQVFTQAGNAGGFVVEWNNGSASSYSFLGSTGLLSANTWHFLAFTYDGSTLSGFIDGRSAGTATLSKWTGDPTTLLLGKDMYSADIVKGALYDELVILDYAADPKLIRAIYESDAPVVATGYVGAALTAANDGVLNTGDATSDAIIGNMRTRIDELESRLKAAGLLV